MAGLSAEFGVGAFWQHQSIMDKTEAYDCNDLTDTFPSWDDSCAAALYYKCIVCKAGVVIACLALLVATILSGLDLRFGGGKAGCCGGKGQYCAPFIKGLWLGSNSAMQPQWGATQTAPH